MEMECWSIILGIAGRFFLECLVGKVRNQWTILLEYAHFMVQIINIEKVPGEPRALGRFTGDGRIEIIKGLPDNLYRSTLAHEIGHLALYHDIRPRWDSLESISESDPHEREAWDFAGELLLPGPIFKKEFFNNPDLDSLASLFAVSKELLSVELVKRRGLL